MRRESRDMIIASCICALLLGVVITVAASADRKVSASEIIVLSDDIHKRTTTVVHDGENPSGVEPGPSKSKSKSKSKTKSKTKSKS